MMVPTHRIITGPLSTRGAHPGPIEIKMTPNGIVFITVGGKNIQVTGGATGTWPSPVVIADPAVLDKLRQPQAAKIEITYTAGELAVRVVELRKPRQVPVSAAVMLKAPEQLALGF
jgi:hypothetical protein